MTDSSQGETGKLGRIIPARSLWWGLCLMWPYEYPLLVAGPDAAVFCDRIVTRRMREPMKLRDLQLPTKLFPNDLSSSILHRDWQSERLLGTSLLCPFSLPPFPFPTAFKPIRVSKDIWCVLLIFTHIWKECWWPITEVVKLICHG